MDPNAIDEPAGADARPESNRAFATDALELRVEALEAELRLLRLELASELRTRRVVVEEQDGFSRIVLQATGDSGQVQVVGRTTDGEPTCVELFASDPIDGDGAHIGCALTDRGNIVGALEVLQYRKPMIWVDRRTDPQSPL